MSRGDRDLVKEGLKDRIEDWCRRLLPDGRREGRLWVAHNPRTGDAATHPKDPVLKVALDRDRGAWVCHRSGDKGDVIRLAEHCLGLDFKGAMDFAREFLGMRAMTPRQRADFSAEIAQRKAVAEKSAAQRQMDRHKAVLRLWNGAGSLFDETPAAWLARRYLAEGRGIPISAVRHVDRATFRVHPALEWWEGAQWSTRDGRRRKLQPGPKFPAIVCGFRSPTGVVTGVHCTFLDPARPAKAPVRNPKLMFGDTKGSVIAISLGPGDEPHEISTTPCPTVTCEGVEDGVTLAIGLPEARVWACGALGHMAGAPVWLPCVSAVFVAADNDWNNRTALEQFDKVLAEISAHDKPVEVMRSAIGKDFNDGMTE